MRAIIHRSTCYLCVKEIIRLHTLDKHIPENLTGAISLQTYTGNILIAINPFQRLPHIYDAHMMQQYKGAPFGELSPHVFAVADVAYRLSRYTYICIYTVFFCRFNVFLFFFLYMK